MNTHPQRRCGRCGTRWRPQCGCGGQQDQKVVAAQVEQPRVPRLPADAFVSLICEEMCSLCVAHRERALRARAPAVENWVRGPRVWRAPAAAWETTVFICIVEFILEEAAMRGKLVSPLWAPCRGNNCPGAAAGSTAAVAGSPWMAEPPTGGRLVLDGLSNFSQKCAGRSLEPRKFL